MAELDVITTVSEQVEGREIATVGNVVFGIGVADLGGGPPHNTMEKALDGMRTQASKMRADAVVGVRLAVHPVGNCSLMLAYGTAVKLASLQVEG